MVKIVGIVNITDDSFSDGGRFRSIEAALAQAEKLWREGANFIELGPASSNPDAGVVSPAEELSRITPVIEHLKQQRIPFGVDSFHPQVQLFAASQGANFINDIRGFSHPEIYPALADSASTLVVMHAMQAGGRASREHFSFSEVWTHLTSFFQERLSTLAKAGISRDRLVIDPGMGFFLSADPFVSLQVIRRLPELQLSFDAPLFLSVSRKSFIRELSKTGLDTCAAATLAAELLCIQQGATYIRTHEVAPLVEAIRILESFTSTN